MATEIDEEDMQPQSRPRVVLLLMMIMMVMTMMVMVMVTVTMIRVKCDVWPSFGLKKTSTISIDVYWVFFQSFFGITGKPLGCDSILPPGFSNLYSARRQLRMGG